MACKTFHKGKYYVTFKRGFEDIKRDLTLTMYKVFESDSLRICLSDDEDSTFLCLVCITRMDYEDLKKQQGLLVDFDNFPSQLVRLLQQCASNVMFLIMNHTNPVQYFLEIVEHNEFKRLVHLSLKTGPAADSDVKQHMADTINNLKNTLSALKSSTMNSEAIWNEKCTEMEQKIHDLTHIVSKMEEDKCRRETEFHKALEQEKERLTQEKLQMQKNMEANIKMQTTLSQDILNKKDKQIEELNCVCKQLKDKLTQLDLQLSEKNQRLNVLEKEVQKSHIEVATLKAKNTTLEQDINEKEKQCNQLNSRCAYVEKVLKDNADTIKELSNNLQITKKEKTNLEDRLAISESRINKNNEAVHATSEQLLKANQIISKQNADFLEMKEKLLCRTAIALEQEKVIECNAKEIQDLKTEINTKNENIDKLNKELENLKDKFESTENILKDRNETIKNNNMVIQWLHKKLEDISPHGIQPNKKSGALTGSSSTPYFLEKNNHTNSSHAVSDESIDFYATSKLSSIEDSPGQQIKETNDKVGLDTKYLKPTATDIPVPKFRNSNKAETQTHKGKENININLPKVDYREKKSARSNNTYRKTPISAYFP